MNASKPTRFCTVIALEDSHHDEKNHTQYNKTAVLPNLKTLTSATNYVSIVHLIDSLYILIINLTGSMCNCLAFTVAELQIKHELAR